MIQNMVIWTEFLNFILILRLCVDLCSPILFESLLEEYGTAL